MYVLSVQYSCAVVSVFLFGGKANLVINLYVKRFEYSICIRSIWTKTNTEISSSFWLTLFYSIPLLALTDGWTEEQIYPGWAGHPAGFLQVNPGWAGHPDGFLQVNPRWAG